ncbi:hypothetical protein ADL15_24240 [Actinoplanes awajinensis subsp. mycoplanecinus]|uniref:Histidine kinase/HSP90-like ATPase domain-containing protein n=1 Tax=Actinoplanes awajinensis subsp. mycoplanecinus TaxID=135947 RepID=A0A117MQU9_9ACTN|nr:hypothetical protein ADL15_24240 [Actinoplanes awajinensis subsp. mycoplanecinus]
MQLLSWNLTGGDDLGEIRAGIHRHFEDGLTELAGRMALVVTELAGNALRHGRPPIVVRVLQDADCYLLDVADHAPEHIPRFVAATGSVLPGGRGLLIASTLAQQVCWYPGDRTKHIWASFPFPAEPTG